MSRRLLVGLTGGIGSGKSAAAEEFARLGATLGLIEKAEEAFDADSARKLEQSLRKKQFGLEQFRDTLRQVRRMGPLESVLGMIPGVRMPADAQVDSRRVVRMEAIVDSMTAGERRDHRIINGSRRKRIARGSGTSVQEVNQLLKQYLEMRKLFQQLGPSPSKGQLRRLIGR